MIVDAAERLMADGGLVALSAREVAKQIGYSPGTLYNMFDNIDDVIVMVEARVLDRLMARLKSTKARRPEDQTLALAHAYTAFTQEEGLLWNVLFEHRLPPDRQLPDWYMAKLEAMLTLVEDSLKPHMRRSEAKLRRRAARVLWSSVQGITALSTSGKLGIVTEDQPNVLVENLVRVYLEGLSRPKGAARGT
jgi:AcrR family transcriptional regulator